MRIGELARRTGLSVHAIRWYEGQRLIPGVRRTAAGHREYADWHEAWLALLDRLKLTGMSIAQMAAYTALVRKGESTLDAQVRLFVEHRARAAAEIDAKRRALAHIDRKIAFLQAWQRTGVRPPVAGLASRRKSLDAPAFSAPAGDTSARGSPAIGTSADDAGPAARPGRRRRSADVARTIAAGAALEWPRPRGR